MTEVPFTRVPSSTEFSPEPLWRDVLGARLRAIRLERHRTLIETARRAGISPQYLSEVERGRKEPSSEMIAAILGALGVSLVDLTAGVSVDLATSSVSVVHSAYTGPVLLAA